MLAEVMNRYGQTFRVFDRRYDKVSDFIHDLQEHGYRVLRIID